MPGYADAGLVLFTGAAATPCSGGAALPGPFYCPETGTIAADLGFLDTFGDRLDRSRDLGLALVAARLAAEHLQREMGLLDAAALRVVGARRAHRAALTASLALQADCMTGVWAAAAAGRLGPVPDGLYDRIVWSWRNVVADLRRDGVRVLPVFDPMAAAPREERAAAFRQGYRGGDPRRLPGAGRADPGRLRLRHGRSRSSGSSAARRGVPSGWTGSGRVRQVPDGTAIQALP